VVFYKNFVIFVPLQLRLPKPCNKLGKQKPASFIFNRNMPIKKNSRAKAQRPKEGK